MCELDLKTALFVRTRKALDAYTAADHALELHIGLDGLDGMKKIRDARYQRFCALWDVIEDTGLVDEYQAWKEARE